ncbi:MAG TPA: flavodoxin family protein [Desulfosarcina sp.]|nr:flavodoxin family protein [Desulfosarcina sp.]
MIEIAAVYGSPRRRGNTSTLLGRATAGARDAGARITEVVLRDQKMSPCLEIYGCKDTGRCVIEDDFRPIEALLMRVDGLMLASPIFFYAVSAHTKILMDRCNSLWVKKYWIDKHPLGGRKRYPKKGLFITVGSTRGHKLFDGAILSVRYFMDALDMALWKTIVGRGMEAEDAARGRPEMLDEAYQAGKGLVLALHDERQEDASERG